MLPRKSPGHVSKSLLVFAQEKRRTTLPRTSPTALNISTFAQFVRRPYPVLPKRPYVTMLKCHEHSPDYRGRSLSFQITILHIILSFCGINAASWTVEIVCSEKGPKRKLFANTVTITGRWCYDSKIVDYTKLFKLSRIYPYTIF